MFTEELVEKESEVSLIHFKDLHRFESLARNLLTEDRGLCYYNMIVFDVDQFSEINRRYGYLVGNNFLAYIESVLKANVQEPDLYCRLYDDHFALFLKDCKDIDLALYVIQLSEEVSKFSPEINNKLSFGICRTDSLNLDILSLCNCAIYAKNTIKGQACQFLANYNELSLKKHLNGQTESE